MISALAFAVLTASVSAKKHHSEEANVAATSAHPWYVKVASQGIVEMCFFGGLMGGMGGGYTTIGGAKTMAPATAVSISEYATETYLESSATTLYTTIPGQVITIYGTDSAQVVSTLDAATYTSVVVDDSAPTGFYNGTFPVPSDSDSAATDSVPSATDSSDPTDSSTDSVTDSADSTATDMTLAPYTPATTTAPTTAPASGLTGEIERLEEFAHALAEALIAPREMTALFSDVFAEIADHGFIHATNAVQFLSRADQGVKALHTNPAYAKQRKLLEAQPTPVNYKKAVAHATAKYTKGVQKMLAEPSGNQVVHLVKQIGERFVRDFHE